MAGSLKLFFLNFIQWAKHLKGGGGELRDQGNRGSIAYIFRGRRQTCLLDRSFYLFED